MMPIFNSSAAWSGFIRQKRAQMQRRRIGFIKAVYGRVGIWFKVNSIPGSETPGAGRPETCPHCEASLLWIGRSYASFLPRVRAGFGFRLQNIFADPEFD
jgi:hypothetical protein